MREIKYKALFDDGEIVRLDFKNRRNILRLIDCQHEAKITQYAGLKYKNGEEIYEGDKIIATYMKGKWFKGVVEFIEGSFVIRIEEHYETPNLPEYDIGQVTELNNFLEIEKGE